MSVNIYNKLCTGLKTTQNRKDQYFAAFSSFVIVCLVFVVFAGQGLFSDVITFAKSGDQHLQCFPFFVKLGDWLRSGILSGVDVYTFNGATEFAYRANLPSQYIGLYPFALLNGYFPARLMYILFFAVQLYFSLYFGQRVGQVYFNFSNQLSLLLAASSLHIFLYESWHISFYIISTLVFPLMYFSLRLLDGFNKRAMIFLPLPFILAFTSGYVTISVALVAIVVIFAFAYGWIARTDIKRSTVFWRLIIPIAFATLLCFLYYWQVLDYANNIVQVEGRLKSLAVITDLSLNLSDLPLLLLNSFAPTRPLEQDRLTSIGIIWGTLLIGLICEKEHKTFNINEKVALWFGFGASALIFVCGFGLQTPIAAWFYSVVPILGQMHLPTRYLMVTLPMFYLALCIIVNKKGENGKGFNFKKIGVAFCILPFVLAWVSRVYVFKTIIVSRTILELILSGIAIYLVGKYGWKHRLPLLALSTSCVILAVNMFYASQSISSSIYDLNEVSIVYNSDQQKILDDFIATLPEQEIYRIVTLDQKNYVPYFTPNNYSWLGLSSYRISDYYGYEGHLSTPKAYSTAVPTFNAMNWQYIADTGGDFLIADSQAVEDNKVALGELIDGEAGGVYLGNGMVLYPFKSFIPVHYTQQPWVESTANCLNNGYFYCPTLTNDDVQSFATDNATRYEITLSAEESAEIAFQLYPNRYYKYYVNNQQITPIIDSIKAYIPIDSGVNIIEIRYENVVREISILIFAIYYFMLIISMAGIIVGRLFTK